ncbi:hypothetical protein SAMN02745664_1312 [Moraxella cuniculi DSM 21768]|uniref:Uncharacterized protein n=1 Tax=Moraxella cuniculi DSM 21768 TaxID=1122245 RepID=A0A1N7GBG0_9GAMM|nr:hypothetical protein [Moraxella cuniculi]OOS02162.1 hypothetical protein B0189_10970 [Moraxella cuniculi]SIS09856.1 hypothetical protein SAMN02745664_1312 [Moraxella cuniculi DSM 21768]
MPNNLADLPFFVKVFAVIIGAVFAMTLTGDIDSDGRLKLSFGVFVKITFSAVFGFLSGAWLIEYMDWSHWSHTSHGFVMMLCSVFGMTLVGILYQSALLSLTDKKLSEIIAEIKLTFKSIFK